MFDSRKRGIHLAICLAFLARIPQIKLRKSCESVLRQDEITVSLTVTRVTIHFEQEI